MKEVIEKIEECEQRIMLHQMKWGFDTVFDFIEEDLDFIKSKIKNIGSELGVLDAPLEPHGDLLAVGESHASGADYTEDSEHTSAGTLGKIIDFGSHCRNRKCVWNAVDICKSRHESDCKGKMT